VKLRGKLITALIVIIILAVLTIYIADRFFNLDMGIQFTKTEKTAVSVTLLGEVREILSFNTVEYVYKTVFPFDFAPPETDWDNLRWKQQRNAEITEAEKKLLEVYELCSDVGIRLDSRTYVFVVITSVVKGGFDLQNTVYENPHLVDNLEDYIRIDEESNILYVRLPDPVIVDLIIEDSTSENYKYPDLGIEPENWKKLTAFIAREIEGKVIEEGILDAAQERGEEFFRKLFLEAGYHDIIFMEDS